MSISEELNAAKKYALEVEEYFDLVKLTLENVARVEAMLQFNSYYSRSGDKNAGPKGKYKGSSAYWINKLIIDGYCEDTLSDVIQAIDRENSTHLNADGKGYIEIPKRIFENYCSLSELKKELNKDDSALINLITEKTGDDKGDRTNFSFATKFCHYMSFALFHQDDERDKYSIYDGILRKAIPKYVKEYSLFTELLNNKDELKPYRGGNALKYYQSYQNVIDSIRDAAEKRYGCKISRNGFDHLLWYYYKAQRVQTAEVID